MSVSSGSVVPRRVVLPFELNRVTAFRPPRQLVQSMSTPIRALTAVFACGTSTTFRQALSEAADRGRQS